METFGSLEILISTSLLRNPKHYINKCMIEYLDNKVLLTISSWVLVDICHNSTPVLLKHKVKPNVIFNSSQRHVASNHSKKCGNDKIG